MLSRNERLLLDHLIHCDHPKWWSVVPDVDKRNVAIVKLLRLGLVEIKDDQSGMRATELGVRSNQKSRRFNRV